MRRLVLLLCLLVVAAPAMATLTPVNDVQIGAVRYHAPKPTRDAAIERAIAKAVSAPAGTKVAYLYDTVTLRDGGKPQVLVLLEGSYFCGSGGCMALILDSAPFYALLARFTLMNPEWLVTRQKHHGWRDIVVRVSGGGAKPCYTVLAFDGKTYPENPSTAPEVIAGTILSGDVYLTPDKNAPEDGYLQFKI